MSNDYDDEDEEKYGLFGAFEIFGAALFEERDRHYENLKKMMEAELQPTNYIERFWLQDLVSIRWDIFRCERHKIVILEANAEPAMESLLLKLHSRNMLEGAGALARAQARSDMTEWRTSDGGRNKIDAMLRKNGFSEERVHAEAFTQSAAVIEMLDRRIASLQRREILLLREFGIRREFARRVASSREKLLASSPLALEAKIQSEPERA